MEMFDVIRFDCDFIIPHLQTMSFQTNDFFKNLDYYVVSKEGRLFLEKGIYEDVPENKRPYFGTPEWDKEPFVRLIGSSEKKVSEIIPVNHSGAIMFIGTLFTMNNQDMFYKFEAGFNKGILAYISVLEERPFEREFD